MLNFSTLIYFVNKSQNDFDPTDAELVGNDFEELTKEMEFEPSERSVKNILDFARSYDVIETESAGYAEMNLN